MRLMRPTVSRAGFLEAIRSGLVSGSRRAIGKPPAPGVTGAGGVDVTPERVLSGLPSLAG